VPISRGLPAAAWQASYHEWLGEVCEDGAGALEALDGHDLVNGQVPWVLECRCVALEAPVSN
jgi:hypothetical protein